LGIEGKKKGRGDEEEA